MDNDQPQETITARNSANLVGGILLLSLALAFWLFYPRLFPAVDVTLMAGVMGSLLGGLGAYATTSALWLQITAGKDGLKWRDWRGTHTARWEEVADYYEVLPDVSAGSSKRLLGYTVETTSGEACHFGIAWANYHPLMVAIKQRTPHLTTTLLADGTRGWTAKGARPADFPYTFAYYHTAAVRRHKRNPTLARTLALASMAGMSLPATQLARQIVDGLGDMSFPFLCGLLALIVLCLGVPGVFFTMLLRKMGREAREARERAARGERFVAEQDGLSFSQNGERYFARWETISGYDFGHKEQMPVIGITTVTPGIIRVADGRAFPVSHLLWEYPLFQNIVCQYATEAVEAQITANEKEVLGGVAARWTGGEEGKGERVYHARLRALRYSLWKNWCLGIVTCIFLVLPDEKFNLFFLLGPLFLIAAIFGTARYWTYRVLVGEKGITEQNLGHETFLAWDDIQEVRTEGNNLKIISTTEKSLTVCVNEIAYGSELKERIDEHLRRRDHRRAQGDYVTNTTVTDSPGFTTENPVVVQTIGERR